MPKLTRHEVRHPDGRAVYLFGEYSPAPSGYQLPESPAGSYERRWNPLRAEWVLVAASRQGRTFLPGRSDCPLCPSIAGRSTEIPASGFKLAVFENRFPAMKAEAGGGACEVVVYTDRHDASLNTLSPAQLSDLMEVWANRYEQLGSRPDVKYVYIFENRGEAVGVTLHHPHGQIYGYPFIPPVAATELRAGRAFARRTGRCLQCDLVSEERKARDRFLFMEAGIVAYVPSYARWPYEVHVVPVRHLGSLTDLSKAGRSALGRALQRVTQAYDRLFDVPMPYMMVVHQRPTDGQLHPEAHLHVEFYPLMRIPGRLKFLAGGEVGAGTFVADGLPEVKAAELRKVL